LPQVQAPINTGADLREALPSRFKTARSTILFDRFMTHFIKIGGIGIIVAVAAIFFFIFAQTLPLMSRAKVTLLETLSVPAKEYKALGIDEWAEKPFLVEKSGRVTFYDLVSKKIVYEFTPDDFLGSKVLAVKYDPLKQRFIYGTGDGNISILQLHYDASYEGDQRLIMPRIEPLITAPVLKSEDPVRVRDLASGDSGETMLVAGIFATGEKTSVPVAIVTRESSLMGFSEPQLEKVIDLSSDLPGKPIRILVNSSADGVLAATEEGDVHYFRVTPDVVQLRQSFRPFEDQEDQRIGSLDYINGEVSVSVTNGKGLNRIFSLAIPQGEKRRIFVKTKEFEPIGGAADFFSASLRNKAFLTGHGSRVSLRYSTTETVRWEKRFPFEVKLGALSPQYDRILLLDSKHQLHFYNLKDPHPQAGWKAFFKKLWYEGYPEADFVWQTSGSTDDFEPKLSMVPLIIGTLKGTWYALIFSLPIALLGALYTSQFAHPKMKLFIKPTLEIMASLPSVVLGFLAALWLAPLIETKVPSLMVVCVLIPVGAMMFGAFWGHLPIRYRKWIPLGFEWLAIIPVLALLGYWGWQLGPVIEKTFFVFHDPDLGIRTADFRLWWPQATGTPFNQRNSLVVGFMMGFAVIPIIFTIAEDALSNVPKSLISGSLALGASRWQTAVRVVLPTAFPGIFSAIMIGLGRAIGETMIVVMATGNTPVMNFSIFSGMRTLSANIAVELPEAPYLGTLYRTLFLGAVILFVMTFIVNTVAEVVRQRFRAKYKTV
jgi:phosphate transport system permease protein